MRKEHIANISEYCFNEQLILCALSRFSLHVYVSCLTDLTFVSRQAHNSSLQ